MKDSQRDLMDYFDKTGRPRPASNGMRILMVIGQFYPIIGGAERQCLKLSKALKARGHEVKVLAVWNPRNVPRKDTVEGVPVERVWYPVINVFGYRIGLGFLAPFFMFWRAYRVARAYDVIHAHQCLWPAFAATIAARLCNKPVVCKIGNSGERFDLNVLRKTHVYGRIAAWYVKKHMTKFVWTSKAVHDDLVREGIAEEKLVYIPNGVELPELDIKRSDLRRDGDRISPHRRTIFIFTGTFTLKKNLSMLLEAIHTLPPQYREKMRLLLLGDGSDRAILTEIVKQYNLNSIIDIQGPVDRVEPYLEKSDVFILPSSTEGLSNSALEAMAHGLPVVLSNRGGNSDLVAGNGILIDPDNVESLAQAMEYMISHPDKRRVMGDQSRRIVEQTYSIESVAAQYGRLYQELLKA